MIEIPKASFKASQQTQAKTGRKVKLRNLSLFFCTIVGIGCVLSFLIEDNFDHNSWLKEHSTRGVDFDPDMHSVVNCTPLAVNQFPDDLFTLSERRHGALLFHCVLVMYMFVALAIVCDDFFVPALEAICKGLKLKEDVAGATFMAIGSSTPELFTSVIGVYITKDDIGVGTIVGSAVFNIVFIIALCALLTDAPISLSWYPLIRDCGFYTLSIIALVFVIYDHVVTW